MSALTSSDHVVVVGAGLAGWRLVDSLRREGFAGALTLIGDESHEPYERPPLSKQVLSGKWEVDKATLTTRVHLEQLGVRSILGVAATILDPEGASVSLADGQRVSGTHVVIATGARARALRYGETSLATLRTRDDAERLGKALDALEPESVVAIIGGGFLGAEAATSVKARGLTPVVLEVAPRALTGVLGEEVSSWLARIPEDHGVELRTSQEIVEVVEEGGVFELCFAVGAPLRAHAVLAAVGSSLELAWLESSGLALDGGVNVDENLHASARVAAIGDVARFPLAGVDGDEMARVEHWEVANVHAQRLARHWALGEVTSEPLIPYFWSDQYGKKIQLLGHPRPSDEAVMVNGDVAGGRWLALYQRRGLVTGVVALSQPRWLMLSKVLLEKPTTIDEARASAPWAS